LPHLGLGIVAVTYVRAFILAEQEQLDAGAQLARQSAEAALHLGSTDRWMRALHLQAEIRFRRGDVLGAIELFTAVLRYGAGTNDNEWIARETRALGICHIESINPTQARRYLSESLRLYTEMRSVVEMTYPLGDRSPDLPRRQSRRRCSSPPCRRRRTDKGRTPDGCRARGGSPCRNAARNRQDARDPQTSGWSSADFYLGREAKWRARCPRVSERGIDRRHDGASDLLVRPTIHRARGAAAYAAVRAAS